MPRWPARQRLEGYRGRQFGAEVPGPGARLFTECVEQMMKPKHLLLAALLWMPLSGAAGQTTLAPPHFHHLALNSVDPEAAIAFYLKEFPSTARTSWEGMPALKSPANVLIVFQKLAARPPSDPEITAYWHFGWNVAASRKSLEAFRAQKLLVPLYTDDHGDYVGISSDTYPY